MANRPLHSLSDLIRQRANLSVECGCGRGVILDAQRLYRWALCFRWSTQLCNLHQHLKCKRCGSKALELRATFSAPVGGDPFPVDEAGWEELVERLRD